MIIDNNKWHICKICDETVQNLAKKYGGCGVYYSQVFTKHLLIDHDTTPLEYFTKYDVLTKCTCGICNKDMRLCKSGKSYFKWAMPCGRYEGTKLWSEKAKITRKGKNNPMYGKKPWNKDQTKHTNASIAQSAAKNKNKQFSDETKLKMSEAAKIRTVHGHAGHKHSEENKIKFRENTLQMIKDGKYKQTKTKPHIKLSQILDKLNLQYDEEVILEKWAFDFYLPQYNLYIEVDGDYFHSNPKIYPNGPKTKTQKINHYRDTKKNEFCTLNNIKLIRFWENEVLNNEDYIICTLKKLLA